MTGRLKERKKYLFFYEVRNNGNKERKKERKYIQKKEQKT